MSLRDAVVGSFLALISSSSAASDLATLPVRAVTVFKDGHAFVVRHGEVEVSNDGGVRIKDLPQPVMGTFWPFVDDPNAALRSVLVRERAITQQRPAKGVEGFLQANVGKRVRFRYDGEWCEGRISDAEPDSKLVMIESDHGYQLFPTSGVANLEFPEKPSRELTTLQRQAVLEMQLQWNAKPAETVSVGMMYLQRGIRWIPSYRIVLGEDGSASVRLQATLINELIDLEDTEMRLVVGVPSFLFKETLDPMGGGAMLVRGTQGLSQYFEDGSDERRGVSNAMVTQVSRMSEFRGGMGMGGSASVAVTELPVGSEQQGEQQVFALSGGSLPRGGRQVHTLGQWRLPAKEVYRLAVHSLPPSELRSRNNSEQMNRLLEMMRSPTVKRWVRLTNTTGLPLTTAPALIIDGQTNRLLAQSIMTYSAVGSQVDLEVAEAVDLKVTTSDRETKRWPHQRSDPGQPFDKIELTSSVTIRNFRSTELSVEIERELQGEVGDVSGQGVAVSMAFGSDRHRPPWYWHYGWPAWWSRINPNVVVRWEVPLTPGESETVRCDWHYFWR